MTKAIKNPVPVNSAFPEAPLDPITGKAAEMIERAATLLSRERQLQHICDNAAVMLAQCGRDYRYVFVNRTCAEFIGRPAEEILGKPISEILGAAAFEAIRPYVDRVLAGERVQYEKEIPYAATGSRWMRVVYVPDLDAQGRICGWIASITDITDRKRAEERFHELADNIDQLVWACDELGQAIWYNRRWYEYTGTKFEEMKGDGWKKLHDPAHLDHVVEGIQRSVASGEPWEDTFPLRGKDGSYRWFLSRAVPVRDESGRIVRWLGTNTDVTELRRLEEALLEADARKDEFLAVLAHELRNPLAPLRNALHLVRMANPNPNTTVREAHDLMERQVEHLVRLVDDLLDVSRITRGKIELKKEHVDLLTVVARAVEGSRPLIDARKHILEVSLPDQSMPVLADPVRLAQVLWNLLNNAAKYTPEGGRIWLRAELEGGQAVIRVKDTGMGIPPKMLPKVFDLFLQMDRTLDRAEGGLGIGLTLVRRLTAMHGGTVEARSEGVGQGCEFIVRLPALLDKPVVQPDKPADAKESFAQHVGRRILVVDDNLDSTRSLAMLLRLFGNDVRTAHDGRLALQIAASYCPHVVLLDIGLPGMDGLEVCTRLRKLAFKTRPLIVAMTGYGQEDDRRRTQEVGFDAHFVKPLDFEALQELLAHPELAL
jgi:PAS domain S-box-containing protein